MHSSMEPGLEPDTHPEKEARALFSLCAVKEFLVSATLFLVLLDASDLYWDTIKISGITWLPFPGNHTQMRDSSIPELNYYDVGTSFLDFCSCLLLLLSVCGNSIDGIVCSLCGLTSAMLLELCYMLWLCVAVSVDSMEGQLADGTVWALLAYTVFPYLGLLAIRCYVLMKAQAFRRSLKRSKEFRQKMNEKRQLLAP